MGKKLKRDYVAGFDNVSIDSPKFFKLLRLNRLVFTNRRKNDGAFVWGFKDGHIVAEVDPITGESSVFFSHNPTIGVAGSLGIEGTKSFKDRVVKFLKRNADYSQYDASTRRFI